MKHWFSSSNLQSGDVHKNKKYSKNSALSPTNLPGAGALQIALNVYLPKYAVVLKEQNVGSS